MIESESTSPSIERSLGSGRLGSRIDRRCPVCKSGAMHWKSVRSFEIAECETCAHRFLVNPVSSDHVESIYGDDYFFGGGAGYSNYLDQSALLRGRGRDYARRIKKFRNVPGKILDVGAAAGFLLEGWIEEGWRGIGVEPIRSMCKHAEARGIDVRCGTVETLELESDGPWDLISMVQVISHISETVDSIRKLTRYLAPGGLLLVETWDRTSWFARLRGS
ncbi:MAG: methyltransferase domain-containing protein, partial [Planctomycetes bacterium]|nr:methyltransferase domain-containing protein [Planctomycetota bacterium]